MTSAATPHWPVRFPDRLQLYSMPTPNGQKIGIVLEELGLPYEAHRIDITKGEQFLPEYGALNPNGKIPTLVDPKGPGGKPLVIMESGAILIYLAEKTGRLLPSEGAARMRCLQWLFFQVGHLGPMFGQFGHFYKFAKDSCPHPYPLERYTKESQRLLAVLETQLSKSPFLSGEEYSIADIASFPWVDALVNFYAAGELIGMNKLPHVQAWLKSCQERPASVRGVLVCA